MASDYKAIMADNQRRYGTDVGRYGKGLLTDLYDDRTHFIYELIQNAEDALRRRDDPPSRTVRFDLSEDALRISHYGRPFDRRDVEGICGIALSTRGGDLTRIGRFGIGFKSVYGFTDRPEIHSGNEDFGINRFVWPSAQATIKRDQDQTVFIMPLRDPAEGCAEITAGLRRLNLDTLLFLSEVDTIEWSAPTGESGMYVRQANPLADHVRRVTLIGETTGQDEEDQDWLVFSKPIHGSDEELAGHVEVALFVKDDRVLPVSRSPLVVFLPTAVETNLGLRIQGPYRTTPSRDNVPKGDPWNQACVARTGELLVDALLWLREHDMLGVEVLGCLPLNETKFGDESMFRPLYAKVKSALCSRKLLPLLDGGHARADRVKLGRSRDLRDLFSGKRLKQLFGDPNRLWWLTDLISQDRTPEVRRYLMEDLGVEEVTPQTMLPRLSNSFLERQSSAWMCRLYEFLNRQTALHSQARVTPIVRLSNGQHVPARADGKPQAFLPGAVKMGFPTIQRRACRTADAQQFLRALGLSEPHLVDDVIRNILPKYRGNDVGVSDREYAADIERILMAFQTKNIDKRDELSEHLRETRFVRSVCLGSANKALSSPDGLYLATERLKTLFSGVSQVAVVDESCEALRGDQIRELLEACGAVRYILPYRKEHGRSKDPLPEDVLRRLRKQNGNTQTSGINDTVSDWGLRGLDNVLARLEFLDIEEQREKAVCIWEELIQLAERRGRGVFNAEYRWTYYGNYRQDFDAAFVRRLNESAWIPIDGGNPARPELVRFESLGWREDPFVLSKIRFKPPIVDQLATEAGFEPAMLDRLKALGIRSLADLEERLPRPADQVRESKDVTSVDDASAWGVTEPRGTGTEELAAEPGAEGVVGGTLPPMTSGRLRVSGGAGVAGYSGGRGLRPTRQKAGGGPFVSYVAVVGSEDGDPDGLARKERMALEEAAIELILSREPNWERTPPNNEGFDLVQVADGRECGWCEVKAMRGSLLDRPVGMSHAQFKYAQERGSAYWLYIVERAGGEDARIVRIQSPAGRAKTFTFDKGWLDVAEID